jgi:hypothetical protein
MATNEDDVHRVGPENKNLQDREHTAGNVRASQDEQAETCASKKSKTSGDTSSSSRIGLNDGRSVPILHEAGGEVLSLLSILSRLVRDLSAQSRQHSFISATCMVRIAYYSIIYVSLKLAFALFLFQSSGHRNTPPQSRRNTTPRRTSFTNSFCLAFCAASFLLMESTTVEAFNRDNQLDETRQPPAEPLSRMHQSKDRYCQPHSVHYLILFLPV